MTGIKGKIVGSALLAAVMAVSITGCKFNVSYVNNYAEADKYVSGDTTYEADGIKNIDVSWISGEVNIVQSDSDVLKIDENSDSIKDEQKVHTYVKGDTVLIKFCKSGYIKHIDSNYKKLTIEVPANCNLKIDTVSSNVKLNDISADGIDISSVSGDLKGGEVICSGFDFDSTSGSFVTDSLVTDKADMDTVSGDMSVGAIDVNSISFNSTSGNLNITVVAMKSFDMNTVSGQALLDVPNDLGMSVDKSSVSGKFKSSMDFEKSGDSYVYGNGEVEIEFDSTSGDITIK